MNTTTAPRPGRALGLLVRHWACNMTLVHDQGSIWPGFGYTLAEQAALRAIARRVPSEEFWVWVAITVVLALGLFAGFTLLGVWLLAHMSPGHSMESVSGTAFMANEGVELVACLAVGFPAAMLFASVITGRLFNVTDADLPDAPVRSHYVHKMSWQFMRMALLMSAVVVAACLWLPDRVWLLTRCVLPVLAPAVSIATLFYYAHRPRIEDRGAADPQDAASSKP